MSLLKKKVVDPSIVRLQVSISGFGDASCTLYGAFSTKTGDLLISKGIDKLEPKKGPEFVKCGVFGSLDADIIFRDDDIREAIEAWRLSSSSGLLTLDEKAARYDPRAIVEVGTVTETGPTWRIDPTVTSGQIAVLAMTWLARKQMTHASSETFNTMAQTILYDVDIMGADVGNQFGF